MGGEKDGFTAKKISDIKKIAVDSVSIDRPIVDELLKNALSEEEQEIIRMRFGLKPYFSPMNLYEISEKLNKPCDVIRQIEAKALRKLKHPSKSFKLANFLDINIQEPAEHCITKTTSTTSNQQYFVHNY